MKSLTPKNIKRSFDKLFETSEEQALEHDAKLLSFKYLSEIEEILETEEISKKLLAKKIGTSASYITQLFRGDRLLNLSTLAKIQKALNIKFEIKVLKGEPEYEPDSEDESVSAQKIEKPGIRGHNQKRKRTIKDHKGLKKAKKVKER